MYISTGRISALAFLLTTTSLSPALGQVATDGTLGPKVNLSGNDIEVGANLGQIRGQNLFHSFERFGVQTNGKVTFTGPGGLNNVISRVTGGQTSTIDGTLASTVPGADIYLVNPSGVVFGPNARLDVPGSFHASTADELRFKDGAVFSALDPAGSQLSVAAPQAFGFLGDKRSKITVNQSLLEVKEGKTLSLVGGDVEINGNNEPLETRRAGLVRAPAGRVHIAAAGGPASVNIAFSRTSEKSSAVVHLRDGAAVDTSGNGGGSVKIRAGQLIVADQTLVSADNLSANDAAGGIDIEARNIKVMSGSAIKVDAAGAGDAGTITVKAGDLDIQDSGRIVSNTFGAGNLGTLSIEADRLVISESNFAVTEVPTGIVSNAQKGSSGNAGIIQINAKWLEIRGNSEISSNTFAAGNAGIIKINADQLEIRNSRIDSSSTSSSRITPIAGDAGIIEIQARRLLLASISFISTSAFYSEGDDTVNNGGFVDGEAGNAGRINIGASQVDIVDGGAIFSIGSGGGNSGAITITADQLQLRGGGIFGDVGETGSAGTIDIKSKLVLLQGGLNSELSQVASRTTALGKPGLVTLKADQLELRDGGSINTSTSGERNGGVIRIEAGRLLITGDQVLAGGFSLPSGITSDSFPTGDLNTNPFEGDAGSIEVKAGHLEIRDGGRITSNTLSQGNAGLVRVEANHLVIGGPGVGASIASEAVVRSSGMGGNVMVKADQLEILQGGQITSSTFARGDAGTVVVEAEQLLINGGIGGLPTGILSAASFENEAFRPTAKGDAGNVIVKADELEIRNGGQITSSAFARGDAGRVQVNAGQLLINELGSITSSAEFNSDGKAGTVMVTADKLDIHHGGEISSSGLGAGPAGDVRLDVGSVEVTNAGIRTSGKGAEGGRINLTADGLVYLLDAEITSSGIQSGSNASLIRLSAPTIVLNNSMVTSLTGGSQPLQGSGEAQLLGGVTVISANSTVSASSSVETTGLQMDLGSDLQIPTGTFLDADQLLRESCATGGAGGRSTFIRTGKGGLPPSPDRALASGWSVSSSTVTSAADDVPVTAAPVELLPCQTDTAGPQP
jgi:filamentous hemagglutinin family protein